MVSGIPTSLELFLPQDYYTIANVPYSEFFPLDNMVTKDRSQSTRLCQGTPGEYLSKCSQAQPRAKHQKLPKPKSTLNKLRTLAW